MTEVKETSATETGPEDAFKKNGMWRLVIWFSGRNVTREQLYIFLKALLRIELLLLALAGLFFLGTGLLTWHINVKTAEPFIRKTDSLIYSAKSDTLTKGGLDSLSNKLEILSRKQNLNPAFPLSFYDAVPADASAEPETPGYGINNWKIAQRLRVDPVLLKSIDSLETWSRSKLIDQFVATVKLSKITSDLEDKTIDPGILVYNRYRFDQFMERTGYSSNASSSALVVMAAILSLIILTYSVFYYLNIIKEKEYHNQQSRLHEAAQNSQEALLVWDLAQKKLNQYYDRNLNQNNSIFIVSIVVMVAGFVMVLYGIGIYFQAPATNGLITGITTASGTIVQFIGATFLVIYNSTIKQAIQYTDSLQQTSTIGTSIKILDSITNDKTDTDYLALKTEIMHARIEIAKMLINNPKSVKSPDAEAK